MKNRPRLEVSKLGHDNGFKTGKRGKTVKENENLWFVKWNDNKNITSVSSCTGNELARTHKKWCKQAKKKK
jgi:hypothetical protein